MDMHNGLLWVGVSGMGDHHSPWVLSHAAVNRKLKCIGVCGIKLKRNW